ncbi:MAG: sigma-70 family RNA polymerase sigma factor [Myxococcota bacterium]
MSTPDASAVAFERFVGGVRRYVQSRVDDPAARDDLVQEVFLRVHDRRDQVQDDERLAGWIRRIAANVVHDHYRRARNTEELPAELHAPTDPADEPEALDRALIASWLAATVGQLEPQHREVLTLTELQGLTQREAAARLGLSLPAVKARVRRGRAALLQRLERCCHIELDHRGALIGYSPRDPCAPSSTCCPPSDD